MLEVISAGRLEPLVEELATVLRDAPDDPFCAEWVAVPTVGIRRWLTGRLARRLGAVRGRGVVANVAMPLPSELRRRILAADPSHDVDRWQVDRLAFAVVDALDRADDDPVLRPIIERPPGATRYGRARRIADLYDRYGTHRPGMLRAWEDDRDVDATGEPLADRLRWQPTLHRRLVVELGPPPSARLPELLDRLRRDDLALQLPRRCSLFGLSALSSDLLLLVEALGRARDVRLFVTTPSPRHARRVAAAGRVDGVADPPRRGLTLPPAAHPLTCRWGGPATEAAALLAALDGHHRHLASPPARPDLHHAASTRTDAGASVGAAASPLAIGSRPLAGEAVDRSDPRPLSLLARLRADIVEDCAPAGDHLLAGDDRSIRLHGAAGATRQVEVLRDAICELLAADPGLDESDVMVVCPALDRFAGVVEAVLGPSAGLSGSGGAGADADTGVPALRYQVVRSSPREDDPLLDAVVAALDLIAGRADVVATLDLFARAPVRRRHGLDDDALATIASWAAGAQIRWGLDGGHLARHGAPAKLATTTWRAGLDRMLVALAVPGDDRTLGPGGVAPYEPAASDAPLVGRLADLVDLLAAFASRARSPRPAGQWALELDELAAGLCDHDSDGPWARTRLDRALAHLADDATAHVHLELDDVRRVLAERLDTTGRIGPTGDGIVVGELSTRRGVAHRVVAVLGLDADALPSAHVDGDDLVAAAPRLGERDRRADARLALLEAVLAAGDALVVTFDDIDVRTNRPVPPSVLLDELRDALDATLAADRAARPSDAVVEHHPQHPFSPANFDRAGTRSVDGLALAGARRLVQGDHRRHEAPPGLVIGRLPDVARPVLGLDELRLGVTHPSRLLLRGRLGIRAADDKIEPPITHLTRLSPLDRWAQRDGLLAARRGDDAERWRQVVRAAGRIPPGSLGDLDLDELDAELDRSLGPLDALDLPLRGELEWDVDVTLASGRRIVGTVVGGVGGARPGPLVVRASRMKAERLLSAWIDLCVLVATDPEQPWRAVLACHEPTGGSTLCATTAVEARDATPARRRARALEALAAAEELTLAAWHEPLPLFASTSHCLARHPPGAAAAWTTSTGAGAWGDAHDADVVLLHGRRALDEVLGLDETDRARRLAHQLWDALDDSVVVTDLGDLVGDAGRTGHTGHTGNARHTGETGETGRAGGVGGTSRT